MTYKVIDNFLDQESFRAIKAAMESADFAWFYNDSVLFEKSDEELYDYQFTHTLYNDSLPTSDYFFTFQPLWDKIKPISLIRVKANLNPITPTHYYGGWHRDYKLQCNTAVYYMNTNNGWTEFKETGEKVESVENRLLVFDSEMEHSGVTTTDTSARFLLNINYL